MPVVGKEGLLLLNAALAGEMDSPPLNEQVYNKQPEAAVNSCFITCPKSSGTP